MRSPAVALLLAVQAAVMYAGHDVRVSELVTPGGSLIPVWQRPRVRIRNVGTETESLVPVVFLIDSARTTIYSRRETAPGSLTPGAERLVSFPVWNPARRNVGYRLTAFTALGGDTNPHNDTMTGSAQVCTWFGQDTVDLFGMSGYEPEIDGRISRDEYSYVYDMSDVLGRAGTVPQEPGSCLLSSWHTMDYQYFAFDLRSVPTREDGDMVVIYVDEDNDGRFLGTSTREGAHFVFMRGGIDSVVYSHAPGVQCPGCISASSTANGNLQFEVRIQIGMRDGDYTVNPRGGVAGAAVSAWRAGNVCAAWWPRQLPLLEWQNPRRYGRLMWTWLGCDESANGDDKAAVSHAGATAVRGVLWLAPAASVWPQPASLLDISGRRMMELKPGANDIRRLAPGAYFVRSASGVERQSCGVTKVVVSR